MTDFLLVAGQHSDRNHPLAMDDGRGKRWLPGEKLKLLAGYNGTRNTGPMCALTKCFARSATCWALKKWISA
jgi:hypothetical protein